jgi:S1-C subfamily serine protease
MSPMNLSNWAFPSEMQPNPEEARFDLDAALDSIVLLRAEVPEDAFTAGILGTERIGNGVVIREDGLVLTIGYLITEATTIWLNTNRGAAVAGHALAYDQPTGFGLVQPLGKLDVPALPRGAAASWASGTKSSSPATAAASTRSRPKSSQSGNSRVLGVRAR